jgi:two-component system nitrate/nitrite sensor histidine kinase NarX
MTGITESKPAVSTCRLPKWLVPTGFDCDRVWDCLKRCRVLLLLPVLAIGFLVLGISDILLVPAGEYAPVLRIAFGLIGLAMLAVVFAMLWRDFIEPLLNLRNWIQRIREGNLSARMPVPRTGEFASLSQEINELGDIFQSLSLDWDRQQAEQHARSNQKTHALAILYDVAASINVSRDLNDLLTRFLHTLTEVVDAKAAAVRLLDRDGQMRLVASTGLDAGTIEREQVLPAKDCICGKVAEWDSILYQEGMAPCGKIIGRPFFEDQRLSMIAVPLQYRGKTLGVYNLFVDDETFRSRDDLKDLFTSIGRHLGMAIEKARLDDEANRLSIMEERTRIAHELHDSLAQTLASVKFQVRVLDETLHQGDEATTWAELEKIENSIDEANTELRELIAHFRAPVDRRGLLPAVERTVERFRHEGDIHIFLQKEWPSRELPPDVEIQVVRIIQEALANVRKHSEANVVRVLMRGNEHGDYIILVEDDGVGMSKQLAPDGNAGEHVGLSIMRDRARRLRGQLRIESEPGEGTRVLLTFRYPPGGADEQSVYLADIA